MKLQHPAGFVTGCALLLFSAFPSFAIDREVQTEISRLDAGLGRTQKQTQELMAQFRTLERKLDALGKKVDEMATDVSQATDDVMRIQNTSIANLAATDKQFAARLDDFGKQGDAWNWGTQTRDCEGLGKHQQIQNVQSADRKYTLRYLCFDGRAVHLGTEVNLPPEE